MGVGSSIGVTHGARHKGDAVAGTLQPSAGTAQQQCRGGAAVLHIYVHPRCTITQQNNYTPLTRGRQTHLLVLAVEKIADTKLFPEKCCRYQIIPQVRKTTEENVFLYTCTRYNIACDRNRAVHGVLSHQMQLVVAAGICALLAVFAVAFREVGGSRSHGPTGSVGQQAVLLALCSEGRLHAQNEVKA